MEKQVEKVEVRNHSLRVKKEEAMQKLEALQARVEASQTECRQLLREQEVNREEEAELVGNRGLLEMKLQNVMCDRKHLYESHSVQLREKTRQMQALKRMEQAMTMATEQQEHMQSIYDDVQAQLDAVPSREASVQQRMELQKEVDALKVGLEKKLSVAEEEGQKKQQYGMIQELLKESNHLREELHHLRCLTQIKAEERGQKHRELLRAEQLHQLLQHELREKDLIIMDHNKLNTMLQRRISQYSKLCDIIMEEKKKYVKLKQIASQTITELTEQLKILANETEIQRTIVVNKDRSLTKARMKLSNSSKMRDRLRNGISKVAWKHRQISQQSDDDKLELVKLTQMINFQEQALLEMNKNHETAVQRRNFLGIQLLEHEEVLFNYHGKVNVQEAAISKGNVVLETMEKETRDLQSAIKEEKRQIDLKKKKELPLKRKLEGEISMLQIELEVKLAERERQLLEKTLLVDQVTRLSKPLSEQAESCRQDRLSLGKKLNNLRTHTINTNRRLMAISAELSVKQAVALSQQQEIKEKELQMDRCQRRLEHGLPPCPEMEEEWRRMLRDKKRRQRDKEEKERLAEEEEWTQLSNGEYTTAETRPNAYIPQTDSLPLPKPYGAQAPFKPSQPGANMRHIRKPTLKPLEI
uniref:Coiled-coil domain containing 146 n=1 Tax=Scophthalmus maximus TaxID=52904 RepID=A0A8D3BFW8_SCOMX